MEALQTARAEARPDPSLRDPADADLGRRIEVACDKACRAIAPAWPLDRAIAVNPHWERISLSVRTVAARMAVLGDIRVFPPRNQLRQAWASGRIVAVDLGEALAQCPAAQLAGLDAAAAIEALAEPPDLPRLPLLIDVLDDDPRGQGRLSWRQAISHQVSQVCAAYFDAHQAD